MHHELCGRVILSYILRNSGSNTFEVWFQFLKKCRKGWLTMWSISSWVVATSMSSIFQWIKCSHVRCIHETIAPIAGAATASSATLMAGACIRRIAQSWIVVPSRLGCRCHIHNHRVRFKISHTHTHETENKIDAEWSNRWCDLLFDSRFLI